MGIIKKHALLGQLIFRTMFLIVHIFKKIIWNEKKSICGWLQILVKPQENVSACCEARGGLGDVITYSQESVAPPPPPNINSPSVKLCITFFFYQHMHLCTWLNQIKNFEIVRWDIPSGQKLEENTIYKVQGVTIHGTYDSLMLCGTPGRGSHKS